MGALPTADAASGTDAARAHAAFAAVAVGTLVVLAIFAPTFLSMAEIWRRSDTFAHGFLVLPAFLYLAWRKRAALAAAPVRPFWPALLGIAGAGFLWLLGELAGALAPSQFAVVALVPATILAAFGWHWLRVLAFPLAFLFFAVPFGEVFVPTLIDWTADFTVAALRMSGVPVYREGAQFVLPSGNWSVVEGCSGIRYLVASLVAGCFYSWFMYRSTRRRVAFMAAALLVPLVANWLRAYLIVMLGHLSNNRIATGVDHLIYGWVFFGIVIMALFAVGGRWREDGAEDAAPASGPTRPERRVGTQSAVALVGVALVATIWPAAKAALDQRAVQAAGAGFEVAASARWSQAEPFTPWRATALGPVRLYVEHLAADGRQAGLQIALFRAQQRGSQLVTSGNKLVPDDGAGNWHVVERRTGSLDIDGRRVPYREALVRADRLLAVREWYWIDHGFSTSDVGAKISLAFDRLLGRSDASAWVVVFAPVEARLDEGAPALDAFMRDRVPALEAALEGWDR